jgi:hypothetical protein
MLRSTFAALAAALTLAFFSPYAASGQGQVAARSIAPVMDPVFSTSSAWAAGRDDDPAENGPFSPHHWAISVGYRHQYSHRHFVGTTEQVQRQQQGTEVVEFNQSFRRWSDLQLQSPLEPDPEPAGFKRHQYF